MTPTWSGNWPGCPTPQTPFSIGSLTKSVTAVAKLTEALVLARLLAVAAAETPPGENQTSQPLFEPLTERELEVLHLIAQGLFNRQVAAQLYLALDTVKGHNRRIFDKMQVRQRTEAMARARTLGLI